MMDPTPDHAQLEFVAEFLRSEAAPIASRATRELITLHPDIARRWGAVGGEATLAWTEALQTRAYDLAAAVSTGRPEIFRLQLAWAAQAFRARGLPVDDLVRSLGALRESVLDALPEADHAVVEPFFEQGVSALNAPPSEPPTQVSTATPQGRRTAEYLVAILDGDRRRACELVLSPIREGELSPQEVHAQVLCPALREMGRMWHLGEVNVAEEHFATATTLMAMSQILTLWERRPSNGRTLLAASVAGNQHEVGVRMVADTFEAEGWRTIYLGPNVPAPDLAIAAADYRADLACLSVMLPSQLTSLRDSSRALRGTNPDLRIIAGGPGLHDLPALATENGAHAFARTPADAVHVAAKLLHRPA